MNAVGVDTISELERPRRKFGPAVLVAVILLATAFLVLYPSLALLVESFSTGDPEAFPPTNYGFANYLEIYQQIYLIRNTIVVAGLGTIMAMTFGITFAWILVRADLPGRVLLQRLMQLPFYMTPLVGALAWAILAEPRAGLLNQALHWLGLPDDLINIDSPFGIAWVMALFDGTIAYLMVSAAMQSMDPSLEEGSRVLGASKWRTIRKVTLPLLAPAILGAAVFIFAEMLGSFTAALILGSPYGFFVITTAIYEAVLNYPIDYGKATALGVALFLLMCVFLLIYRRIITKGSYATITGKGFQPRPIRMGSVNWLLSILCWGYVLVAVVLPIAAILLTSLQKFATVLLWQSVFTLDNFKQELAFGGATEQAIVNSFTLGLSVATIGVLIMTPLVWIIYRSRLPGCGLIEYLVMFPNAVPRLVFGVGLLWAWINLPLPLYGTLLLLGIAYFTVFLPLGVRTLAGVMLQIDKSLEECARVCGASWTRQLRTITMPLLRPGMVAAWFLLFVASVRELGVSIFLVGPDSHVIGPAVVAAWGDQGMARTSALAMIQTIAVFVVLALLLVVSRAFTRQGQIIRLDQQGT